MFEKFESKGSKFKNYSISIRKSGVGFNGGFYRRHLNNRIKFVEFFYDKDSKSIGFKFYDKETDGAFVISHGNNSAGVGAGSFFGAYGIDADKFSGRYIPKEMDDKDWGKLFIISLKEKEK